ncbi:hypothetical protein F511_25778 [Dorcoceras hygrometricum]|uniref:Uncharacterized protein n=1 Tax=Dorcoceras hygrometricum TaxID=472368 RepID=A0A2Z7B2P2_9LAMI|nr:hypothetical protein F511_25778 [Dorcoceras hygrometricum]
MGHEGYIYTHAQQITATVPLGPALASMLYLAQRTSQHANSTSSRIQQLTLHGPRPNRSRSRHHTTITAATAHRRGPVHASASRRRTTAFASPTKLVRSDQLRASSHATRSRVSELPTPSPRGITESVAVTHSISYLLTKLPGTRRLTTNRPTQILATTSAQFTVTAKYTFCSSQPAAPTARDNHTGGYNLNRSSTQSEIDEPNSHSFTMISSAWPSPDSKLPSVQLSTQMLPALASNILLSTDHAPIDHTPDSLQQLLQQQLTAVDQFTHRPAHTEQQLSLPPLNLRTRTSSEHSVLVQIVAPGDPEVCWKGCPRCIPCAMEFLFRRMLAGYVSGRCPEVTCLTNGVFPRSR